ncbi:hypothetical protein [Kluyvera georgiana]|uniref:hypothetical protein n=1 Tax=Kluyvera georgiana TaxID=73098 RepID=UPI002302D2B5|nr:hypothetical protein [Kluyvera georgiana]MDA8494381.1 hypothetical protein [Kluyvera georgiana]
MTCIWHPAYPFTLCEHYSARSYCLQYVNDNNGEATEEEHDLEKAKLLVEKAYQEN